MPHRRSRPLALLFDLDGTLADSIELLLASFHHAFEARQVPRPSDDAWIAGIGTLVSSLTFHMSSATLVHKKKRDVCDETTELEQFANEKTNCATNVYFEVLVLSGKCYFDW